MVDGRTDVNSRCTIRVFEPRVQTIKAKQDIWTGGPESLGAYWMTETGK
jgi:hypothetical protein